MPKVTFEFDIGYGSDDLYQYHRMEKGDAAHSVIEELVSKLRLVYRGKAQSFPQLPDLDDMTEEQYEVFEVIYEYMFDVLNEYGVSANGEY